MDLIDQLTELASRAAKKLDNIKTEEATKMALVVPFINALGYNVFDPEEVVPEFVADVGIKQGEKVDYAIMKDGKVIILIECKTYGTNLDKVHREQLYRYFSVTESRIGILTDGVTYRFYTDLEESNKMDEKPFLEINLLDLGKSPVAELKNLTKSSFNIDEMLPAAWELKYIRELKLTLNKQLKAPDDEFVKVLARTAYSGVISSKRLEQFRKVTQQAFKEFISDQINSRLKNAMDDEQAEGVDSSMTEPQSQDRISSGNGIVTTEEEIEGYHIVRAILSEIAGADRITYKDTKSYFNVLLDNNSRKPICKLYLDRRSKQVGLFDQDGENKANIETVSDLYKYADQLKLAFDKYDHKVAV